MTSLESSYAASDVPKRGWMPGVPGTSIVRTSAARAAVEYLDHARPALGKRRADGDVLTDRRQRRAEAAGGGDQRVLECGREERLSGGVDDENAADIGGPVDVAAVGRRRRRGFRRPPAPK